jgi:hypothetical protein
MWTDDMKVKLHEGRRASEDAVLALEVTLGCRLCDSFRSFLLAYDGSVPETNTFRISDCNDGGVNGFIPVSEIQGVRRYIENLPRRAYPVAWAECGNYVVIDEDRSGAVFFWDHEIQGEPIELAPNFGFFLGLLEPHDITTIPLKPGQVKRVWVDPGFAERFRK